MSGGSQIGTCDECGFEERRVVDYSVPLLLDWKDGDRTNHL